MELTRDKIERLTFVKYLLSQARVQKNLERPLCSSAILTIHDCVECFLQLCYEVKTGKTKISSSNILDTYSEELNKILQAENNTLINKAFIKRINDLRNQLKHATIFTDHKQIPNLYIETELFLIDFSEIIFDIQFKNISLIELIADSEIKTHLIEAQNWIDQNQMQKAMWSIAKAFYELEKSLNKIEGNYGENILSPHHDVDYLIKYMAQIGGSEPDKLLRENLKEIANDINRLQSEIQNIKTILSLGVDFKEFIYVKQHLPYLSKIYKGGSDISEFWIPDEEMETVIDYEESIVKDCFDFVVELALKND